jgi:hypothetical protein
MTGRLLPCIAVGLFFVLDLQAAGDPWVRIQSANFELFTTAGERGGLALIRQFEQVRQFFVLAIGADLTGRRPTGIIVFRSDKEYQPYRPNDSATAFFQAGADHDFIVMKDAAAENFHVAAHEYTHLLIRDTGATIPLWMNEGLAELYSSMEADGPEVLVGKPDPGLMRALAAEQWIDLRNLVSVDRGSSLYNEKSHAGMFYAESWLPVHMLSISPTYHEKLRDLLNAFKTQDSLTALERVYGKSIERLQTDLRTYFERGKLSAAVLQGRRNRAGPRVD